MKIFILYMNNGFKEEEYEEEEEEEDEEGEGEWDCEDDPAE
jgi:hypothetical protein